LPPKVEFGEVFPEGGTFEHFLFMKKDKLACGTILLNVVDFLLHNVTCLKGQRVKYLGVQVEYHLLIKVKFDKLMLSLKGKFIS